MPAGGGLCKCDVPPCLPEHVHHLHLEDRVDSFYADARPALRHRKHIHHAHREVVDELAQHQAHDFHGHTGAAVTEHLEEGKGGNVDGLGVVNQARVVLPRVMSANMSTQRRASDRDRAPVAGRETTRGGRGCVLLLVWRPCSAHQRRRASSCSAPWLLEVSDRRMFQVVKLEKRIRAIGRCWRGRCCGKIEGGARQKVKLVMLMREPQRPSGEAPPSFGVDEARLAACTQRWIT